MDSYKVSHYLQYPPETKFVSSYIESRGGNYECTVLFGLQMYMKAYLQTPVSHADIDEAKALIEAHGLPFNEAGWRYIVDQHGGYLPIEIEALPEGTVVPTHNCLVQVMNTDPRLPWLTSYLETSLLRAIWYPTTVATVSWHARQLIGRYMDQTCDSRAGIEFKLHDFGARGTTAEEAAAIGGAGHLVNFQGTDTISALVAMRRYYGAPMAGYSIPAAEHSTITSWGREKESDAYANMLARFGGEGRTVAVVSDSYDIWNAVDNIWGGTLKQAVESNGGTLVIRPDSGDPISMVAEVLERLMRIFGYRVNSKGYRELPPFVRLIQGDGISLFTMEAILETMKQRKQSAANVTFGMGGELLQKINRDTLQFAMKASAVKIESFWRDVYKDPVTDPGKRSKRGRLAVVESRGGVKTVREQDMGGRANLLRPVFRNGELLEETNLDEVRRRAGTHTAIPTGD